MDGAGRADIRKRNYREQLVDEVREHAGVIATRFRQIREGLKQLVERHEGEGGETFDALLAGYKSVDRQHRELWNCLSTAQYRQPREERTYLVRCRHCYVPVWHGTERPHLREDHGMEPDPDQLADSFVEMENPEDEEPC